jgi:hypothetical protein
MQAQGLAAIARSKQETEMEGKVAWHPNLASVVGNKDIVSKKVMVRASK